MRPLLQNSGSRQPRTSVGKDRQNLLSQGVRRLRKPQAQGASFAANQEYAEPSILSDPTGAVNSSGLHGRPCHLVQRALKKYANALNLKNAAKQVLTCNNRYRHSRERSHIEVRLPTHLSSPSEISNYFYVRVARRHRQRPVVEVEGRAFHEFGDVPVVVNQVDLCLQYCFFLAGGVLAGVVWWIY